MRCEHEHDDGAYVLGALSPAERAAYERHLATCSFCREAVADIAVLPGLLARLDAGEFAKLLDPSLTTATAADRAASSTIGRAAHAGRGKKRKTRVRILSTAAAAMLVRWSSAWASSRGREHTARPNPPLRSGRRDDQGRRPLAGHRHRAADQHHRRHPGRPGLLVQQGAPSGRTRSA